MRAFRWLCLGLVLGTVVALVLADRSLRKYEQIAKDAGAAREIALADLAIAKVDAATKDTVFRVSRARVDTLRDSVLLRLTDTAYVTRYVLQTDSALQACTDLADSCAVFRLKTDTAIKALSAERDIYKNLYKAAKPSRFQKALPWVAAAGGFWIGAKLRVP
jgi:hypothetical protein